MPVKITITCDTPEEFRSTTPELPLIRCYSSVNDNVIGLYEGMKIQELAIAIADLRKLARFQGWGWVKFGKVDRFICPGCKHKFQR